MPITPTTTLTSVVIYIDGETQALESIIAMNGTTRVMVFGFLFGRGDSFKSGNSDFDELDGRIERGEIDVVYSIRGHGEF